MSEILTAERVHKTVIDCLYREEEVPDGNPPADAVIGKGIINDMCFHPGRLNANREAIREMLGELPESFDANGPSKGMSFLAACETKGGVHWGEHRSMETLFALGSACGFVSYLLPRGMWSALPGGMPYLAVDLRAGARQ